MALDRETVVRTALRLLNEVGLEGLTLRRLAAELHVQAPALYWHFRNKQELLDEMAGAVQLDNFRALNREALAGMTWQEWGVEYGRGLRRMLLRYRDGAKVFSGTYLIDDAMFEAMEISLRKFVDAGFALGDAARSLGTISSYTVGFTIEEQAVYPRPGERSEQYDLARRAERIDAAKLPLAFAVGEENLANFDERFEHGLRLIVAGIATLLARG